MSIKESVKELYRAHDLIGKSLRQAEEQINAARKQHQHMDNVLREISQKTEAAAAALREACEEDIQICTEEDLKPSRAVDSEYTPWSPDEIKAALEVLDTCRSCADTGILAIAGRTTSYCSCAIGRTKSMGAYLLSRLPGGKR